MILLWLCLILFLLYYTAQTIWGLTAFKRIVSGILEGRISRVSLYGNLMAGMWIPALIVLVLTGFNQFSFAAIGLGWFRPGTSVWLIVLASVLAGLYFLYLAFSLFTLRRKAKRKTSSAQEVPERIVAMYPVSRQEKRVWACTAVSAGFTEELLFRGFLMYLLGALFPALPVAAVLAIATVLFGLGHLYQGAAAAVQPTVIGLVLGIVYIAFGTILPCVVLHIMQDLCAMYVVND